MAMTAVERDTHRYIYEYLLDEGYAPYAAIFKNIDLHLTDAKDVVGYMVPDKGYIVINKNLEDN